MMFALAITLLAQPAGPPFHYDLNGSCYDVEDDARWQAGLVTVRIVSDVASGRLDRSAITTLESMVDAYLAAADACAANVTDFGNLPMLGSDVDGREDAMIEAAYVSVLGELRSDAKYLRHVQPIRIQMQAWLTEALQQSLTCRVIAKAGGDATQCEAQLGSVLSDFTTGFTAWIRGGASYWSAVGALVDAGSAQIASDNAQIPQLMTRSQQDRGTVDGSLWPQMLDLQNQAQAADQNRAWCKAMADTYAAQGDFATASSYMYWYGYYDHQFVTLTTQIIPTLSSQMQALETDAYGCDGQVLALQNEVGSLAQRDNVLTQKLVSGVP